MSTNLRKTLAFLCITALGAVSCGRRGAPASNESTQPAGEGESLQRVPVSEKKEEAEPNADPAAGAPATVTATPAAPSRGVVGRGATGYAGPAKPRGRAPARPMDRRAPAEDTGTEDYAHYDVNKMTLVENDALSTFAVDVDTASYSIARRKILDGHAVPADSVRVEEFVNYFKYGYEGPGDGRPFAVHMEAAPSPFGSERILLRVGVQGRQIAKSQRKKANLVFLVDVSGSMSSPDKLPLAQRSLRILVDNLNEGDTVALVTYAGSTRVVLEPTGMDQRARIYAAIDDLSAGGSTAMGSGIELAYKIAGRQISDDSVTRVIVLSDGDANVGNTTHEQILETIKGYVREGVTLSTIGFGMGNYKDTMMEQLANKGNGNNYYIDGLSQAKRVFQEQLGGTLEVIAQDVKIQVEFNPKAVSAYRLVGYENRDVADSDFRNDKVDAGEIGAGHSVTAIYEVELKQGGTGELATVRLRAKKPRGTEAAEHQFVFPREKLHASFDRASADFRFAVAVMGFAEILRKSPYADGWKLDTVLSVARGATTRGDEEREEFITLVGAAGRIM